MNEGYRARRAAKHAAEKSNQPVGVEAGTIDLTLKTPRLSWIGGKMFRQSGQQRKGRSGHLTEHTESFVENGSRTFAAEVAKALTPVEVVDAVIGGYHDYVAMNQHEIVLDPTEEDTERILRESVIELLPETDEGKIAG